MKKDLKMKFDTRVICKQKVMLPKGLSFEPDSIYLASMDEIWAAVHMDKIMAGILVHREGLVNAYNDKTTQGWFFTTNREKADNTFPYFYDFFDMVEELPEELFDI